MSAESRKNPGYVMGNLGVLFGHTFGGKKDGYLIALAYRVGNSAWGYCGSSISDSGGNTRTSLSFGMCIKIQDLLGSPTATQPSPVVSISAEPNDAAGLRTVYPGKALVIIMRDALGGTTITGPSPVQPLLPDQTNQLVFEPQAQLGLKLTKGISLYKLDIDGTKGFILTPSLAQRADGTDSLISTTLKEGEAYIVLTEEAKKYFEGETLIGCINKMLKQ